MSPVITNSGDPFTSPSLRSQATNRRGGRLVGTAEDPQKADGIAALPKTSPLCQQETHAPQQMTCAYSITSSARARSDGGTVSPSALAVLRLITSSNLVGRLDRQVGRPSALQNAVDIV